MEEVAGVHGRHGVVEKKQLVFGDKVWKEDGVVWRECDIIVEDKLEYVEEE